jgi:cysteate synthase
MLFPDRLSSCVKIVCVTGSADYGDAVALAEVISQEEGFFCEGGVRNVGRRDGMATVMLNAVETIGHLPDYYFQAIGSGAGAIAAHEAATRLVQDGRFGGSVPRLMLSQNSPFTPIYDSWRRGLRELVDFGKGDARTRTKAILATVLSNRRPPYGIPGGIFDVLTESQGDMFAIDNLEARQAMGLFERFEGVDIDPAAAVALAALIKAAASHRISRDATILLHLTGGGFRLKASEARMVAASPDLEVSPEEFGTPSVIDKIRALFAKERKPFRRGSNGGSINAHMHAV